MITGLVVGEVGAAGAVIGALWAGFSSLNTAERVAANEKWIFYLVAGGIFVTLLAACRIRHRA